MVDPELIEVLTSFKNEIIGEMNSFKTEIKGEMNSFKAEIKDEMDSFKTEIKDEMDSFKTEIKGEMNSFRSELDSIKDRLSSVENICTVIQEEHGKKLDLLLDYASANMEKHEEYDRNFERIDDKLFDYDVRLSIIEGSELYKKAIKSKGTSTLGKASLL